MEEWEQLEKHHRVEAVELHTAPEVLHTAEEAGHMAGAGEVPRIAVVDIDPVEVRRKVAVGVEDIPVAVGMDYEVAVHKVAAAVEDILGYIALAEGILPVVHILEAPASRHNPAGEGILEVGIGPAEAVDILLPIMSRKQSMRQTELTRWRSSIVRWITALMGRV